MVGDALSAFQTAAGVSADKLSLFVRSLLMTIAFIWAAYCMVGAIHRVKHHGVDEADLTMFIFRVLVIVVFITVLVFI
jgi:integrating conjugative element protein (TIGR03758 family)